MNVTAIKTTIGDLKSGNYGSAYRILFFSATVVHILLFLLGCASGCPLYKYYQLGAILYYMVMTIIWKSSTLVPCFFLTLTELTLNALVAGTCFGSLLSGEMYLALMVMIGNTVYLSNMKKQSKLVFAVISSALSFVDFYALNMWEQYFGGEAPVGIIPALVKTLNIVGASLILAAFANYMIYAEGRRIHLMKLREKNLKEEGLRDSLTGLYNRKKLIEEIQYRQLLWREKGSIFSIIMGDIDFFKKVNDTYGHASGDVVLRTVAETIQNLLREEDFVCRWGGEEFLIILQCKAMEAEAITDRLRKQVEELDIMVGEQNIRVTMSFGISDITESSCDKDIIELADERLYRAKNEGRNRVVWI